MILIIWKNHPNLDDFSNLLKSSKLIQYSNYSVVLTVIHVCLLNTTVVRLYYCITCTTLILEGRLLVTVYIVYLSVYLSVIGLQVLEVDIFEVEEKINYGFTELAVKLSEISFRPIFLKVGS